MEQCTRGTLKDYIKSKSTLNVNIESLCEKEALEIFSKIIEGYSAIRDQGYVHRDIKTENILLRENMEPVLIDLGYCEKV